MPDRTPVQAVTFAIGKEEFAVPVPFVREILDYKEPFAIPNAPPHFVGLIDVRGQGIATIDLRLRLGLPRAEPTLQTRVLVLELPQDGKTLVIGLVIDRALSVSAFTPDEIDTSPDIGVQWHSDYIQGVVRKEGGFIVLVDIARIITGEDAVLLTQQWPQAA
jgi:purine-binding chemotaxis protein CheW